MLSILADSVFVLSVSTAIVHILTGSYATINAFISLYGYIAVVVLMALESASLPIPSEVILPLAGHAVQLGNLNFYITVLASIIGTVIGITIDYWIAYVLEKRAVYKHLGAFHIKKSTMNSFDDWFGKNGAFAVFISRMLPVVRGIISFPAGFAKMSLKDFYLYSIAGALIWNVALIMFGYWALSIANAQLLFAVISVFAIVLYVVYRTGMKRIRKGRFTS